MHAIQIDNNVNRGNLRDISHNKALGFGMPTKFVNKAVHRIVMPSMLKINSGVAILKVGHHLKSAGVFYRYAKNESLYMPGNSSVYAIGDISITVREAEHREDVDREVNRLYAQTQRIEHRLAFELNALLDLHPRNNHPEGLLLVFTKTAMASILGCTREVLGQGVVQRCVDKGLLADWVGSQLLIYRDFSKGA